MKGGTIMLTKDEISGETPVLMHPENVKKIQAAKKANKVVRLDITYPEIQHDILHHAGGSIWDSIKQGLSTVWSYVKPVVSGIGDAIAYSNPELAPLREGVRNLTGVGLKPKKGSDSAKEMMKAVRSKKKVKQAGSFLLA
ncbi:unnamed protein product [Aphanomyces euteiches]